MKMIFTKEYIKQNCGCYSRDFDKYRLNGLLSKLKDKVTLYQLCKNVSHEDFIWFLNNHCEVTDDERIFMTNKIALYLLPPDSFLVKTIRQYEEGLINKEGLIEIGNKYSPLLNEAYEKVLKSNKSTGFFKYSWDILLNTKQNTSPTLDTYKLRKN